MKLTASTFEQITSSLRSDASTARDQRHQPRVGLRARTKIVPQVVDDKGAAPIDVWVKDLSANGIGLTCPRPLPRGSLFLLRLVHQDGTALEIKYKVAHVHQASGGTHMIGAVRQGLAAGDTSAADAAAHPKVSATPAATTTTAAAA